LKREGIAADASVGCPAFTNVVYRMYLWAPF